jgi:hypothetical protein
MVRMSAVWDSTVAVFSGRGGVIVRVALLTLFLPSVIRAAATLGTGPGAKLLDGVLGLVAFVVSLFGTLAITALASDPATGERRAYAMARDTLPGAIGTVVLLGIAATLLLLPGIVLLVGSGFDLRAAQLDLPQATLRPGMLLGSAVYVLVLSAVLLWAFARVAPLYAVLVNERCGVRAIARAFAMTRGLALRIVGVLILFAIVVTVAWLASTWVAGTVFRLVLGDRPPLVGFATALVTGAVTTVLGVIQPVFTARLYAAIRERSASLV